MSEILSAKTSTSKYDGNDVVMFNLADDPYELYNVWDQNKSLGEELAAEIVNAGMSVSPLDGARDSRVESTAQWLTLFLANMIRTTYGTNEENFDTRSNNHPDKTGETSSGWCDGDKIKPKTSTRSFLV